MLYILKHGYDVIIYYPCHFRYPAPSWTYSIACFLVHNLYSSNLRVFFQASNVYLLTLYIPYTRCKRNKKEPCSVNDPCLWGTWNLLVKKEVFVKYKLEDNAYSSVCLRLWVLSVDVQRREGSLYPYLLYPDWLYPDCILTYLREILWTMWDFLSLEG